MLAGLGTDGKVQHVLLAQSCYVCQKGNTELTDEKKICISLCGEFS